jgi:hypothetical protein
LRNHAEASAERKITSFMRSSIDDAFARVEELSAMSARGPSDPLGDRPRMAEALASLKEGLRDTADPLYDSWKLRQVATDRPVVLEVEKQAGPVAATNAETRPPEGAPHSPTVAGASFGGADAIDIALEGTPPETPAASSIHESATDDAPLAEGLATEEVLVEFDEEFENTDEPTIARTPSVQADTVRVRVIRYHPFPRWALIGAASLVVFAVSLVALRASLPSGSTRVARPVLASDVPTTSPVPPSIPPALSALKSVAVSGRASAPGLSNSASATAGSPLEAPATRAGVALIEAPSSNAAVAAAPAPPRAAAPAGKAPTPPPKRRSGAQDFFRDPGF